MTGAYVSIGSNIEREANIRAGIAALRTHFEDPIFSSIYESTAVGFSGDNFFNLVAGFNTTLQPGELCELLRMIEDQNGRKRNSVRFSSRTLDMDLLLYDDLVLHTERLQLPRDEITRNAFVLAPLAEIAPTQTHPTLHVTYAELWQRFDQVQQSLWPIQFDI